MENLHNKEASRNSFVVGLTINYTAKDTKKTTQKSYKDNDIQLVTSNNNEYISVNSFCAPKRVERFIREIKCLYFDLDLHDKPMHIVDEAITNTLQVLQRGLADCKMPKPTMITNTGRGLGLYYVLRDSIPCQTMGSDKAIKHYKRTYDLMYQRLLDVLNEGLYDISGKKVPLLEIDTSVIKDVTRVARLAGTYNTKAKKYCELVYFDEFPKYSLNDIINDYFSDDWKEIEKIENTRNCSQHKSNNRAKKTGNNSLQLCYHRMEAMKALQKLRGVSCFGFREFMCFIYYNHAKQVHTEEYAFSLLKQFSKDFINPKNVSSISNAELKAIEQTTKSAVNYCKKTQGFYRLTNNWIIEKLKISKSEQEKILIFATKHSIQKSKREKTKKNNQAQKSDRNKCIIQMALSQPDLTYKELAKQYSISEKTVYRVCKAVGITRTTGRKKHNETTRLETA